MFAYGAHGKRIGGLANWVVCSLAICAFFVMDGVTSATVSADAPVVRPEPTAISMSLGDVVTVSIVINNAAGRLRH